MKALVAFLGILFFLSPRLAPASFGQDAALLLDEPLSVRPLGLSGAFSSLADDESSIEANPAGLSQVHGLSLGGGQLIGLLGLEASNLVLVSSLNSQSSLGLEVAYLYDSETSYDAFGNPNGSFNNSNTLVVLGWGDEFLPGWRLGLSLKGLQESYAGYNALSLAGDLGIQGPIWEQLRFGFLLQNLGSQLQNSEGVSASLPYGIQEGLSFPLFFPEWLAEVDFQELPNENEVRAMAGTELGFSLGNEDSEGNPPLQASIRAGFGSSLLVEDANQTSFGAGLFLPPNYALDYALLSSADIGVTHRISLTFRFPTSNPFFSIPQGKDLAAPFNVTVTEDVGGIILNWEDPNAHVAGYNIYGDYGVLVERLNRHPLRRRYQRFVNIDKARSYHFFIRAIGADGKEGTSSEPFVYKPK